jgi:hypothetical protein
MFSFTGLVFLLLVTFSLGAFPPKNFGSKASLSCKSNNVLSMLLYSGTSGFVATCGQPNICGKFMLCKGNSISRCGRIGGFIRSTNELGNGKFGRIRRRCCVYPKPKDEEVMYEFCSWFPIAHFGPENKTDIYNSPVRFINPYPDLLIKSIKKNSNGYLVRACTLRCSRTTTRRPTTEKPKEPEQNLIQDSDFKPPSETVEHNFPPEAHPKVVEPDAKTIAKTAPSGYGCFAGDQMVTTPQGPRRMDQLQQHDYVLTSSQLAAPFYERVEWFIHRDTTKKAQFVALETENGEQLKLTAKHLLPIVPCAFNVADSSGNYLNRYLKKAEEASPGDCVVVNGGSKPVQRLVKVGLVAGQGIYSPYTAHGSIIVGNIHASCHSDLLSNPGNGNSIGRDFGVTAVINSAMRSIVAGVRIVNSWAADISPMFEIGNSEEIFNQMKMDVPRFVDFLFSASKAL